MKVTKFFMIGEMLFSLGLGIFYIYNFVATYWGGSPMFDTPYWIPVMVGLSMLIVLFGVCNLVAAAAVGKRLFDVRTRTHIWRMAVIMKIISIPMFAMNLVFGVIFGVFGMFFAVTLPFVVMEVFVAWFAMMASSGYCIALVLYARKQGKIGTGTAVWQVISQFIYVVDVISLFFIRETVKECETAQ